MRGRRRKEKECLYECGCERLEARRDTRISEKSNDSAHSLASILV